MLLARTDDRVADAEPRVPDRSGGWRRGKSEAPAQAGAGHEQEDQNRRRSSQGHCESLRLCCRVICVVPVAWPCFAVLDRQ